MPLLELLGHLLAVEREHAVGAGEVSRALDVLHVNGHDVAGLDRAVLLDVLVGDLIAEELVDLPVDLGLGGLLGRHVDRRGVIALQLAGRAHANGGGDHVVGALGGELGVGALGAKAHAAHGRDVKLLEHERLGGVQEVVGGLGEHGLAADDAVDHRARRVAATEALEVVLLGDVLVGARDGGVDIGSRDGDLGGQLVVDRLLGSGDGDLQRSSSVSDGGPAATSFSLVRAKGLEPSRGLPHWNLNPACLPVPPRPQLAQPYECSKLLQDTHDSADNSRRREGPRHRSGSGSQPPPARGTSTLR